MKIVIQCAGRKAPGAGTFSTPAGVPVSFVAHPELAPRRDGVFYASPDGTIDGRTSWRSLLEQYNQQPRNNPLRLLPAYALYKNPVYGALVKKFGADRTFVLSAGWGLLRSDYFTPEYDITFSSSARPFTRRLPTDVSQDFRKLSDDPNDTVLFIGGKAYVPLFCQLTDGFRGRRIIFYNSAQPPDAPACEKRSFKTAARTNWHYLCAKALLRGELDLNL
jgi:hypothetical protein